MSTPRLLFGAGGIGNTEKSFTHSWTTAEDVNGLLAILQRLGLKELDSAASYPPGNPWHTETLLGQSRAVEKGFVVDTKIAGHVQPSLSEANIASSLERSLKLLGVDQVNILYSHAPDRSTPISESAAAFNKHFAAGKFKELGLCNYTPEEVRQWVQIATDNNYVKPTVYQGHYNAIFRHYETNLFPLLREHGIRFNAYSPLAGGFLTGKVTFASSESDLHRTRWAGESAMKMYVDLFDKPQVHAAIRELSDSCQKHGITTTEASVRWILHHSILTPRDGLILGASKVAQLESNVQQCNNGPLPDEIVVEMERMWKRLVDVVEQMEF